MAIPVWVGIIGTFATPFIAAISASYVLLQYRRAQRWKATDLAAVLLEKLDTDQSLALACQALDYGVGPLIIPDQYRPLFVADASGKVPSVMDHDPNVLFEAVQPILNKKTLQDERGLVYRYCFTKLFNYLDNISKLLADGQLREKDIAELKYWLRLLRYYIYKPGPKDGTLVFQPALHEWGYVNVILLGQRLGVKPWRSPDEFADSSDST
jgi:hypothetical protein